MLSIWKESFRVETLNSFWQKAFFGETLFCTFLPVYMQKFSSVLLLMVVISCNCMPQSPLWRGGCKRNSHSSSSEMTKRLIRHKLSILLLKLQYSVPNLNNPLCSRNFQNMKLMLDFVEIWSFYCHSDFTWNQI